MMWQTSKQKCVHSHLILHTYGDLLSKSVQYQGQGETAEMAEMAEMVEMLSESICHIVQSHPHAHMYLLKPHLTVSTVNNYIG